MSDTASTSLDYRRDIDGLRAVAVLLVLLYHAGFARISGGFIGVDVFFVLTGFLITAILSAEMSAGTFSIQRFYLRRIRRLMPALLFVLAATTVAGFLLLARADLEALLDSDRFTLLSAANVYFWLNTGGYFDADVHELPLLHTWSLGVEEQFYLLWPALLLAGHRYLSRARLILVVAAAVVVGIAVSHFAALRTPNAAYYLLHGRAFEILIGALVALGLYRLPRLSKTVTHALSVLGACLIVVPALLLTDRSTFPGIHALWSCAGTALLLVTGCGQSELGLVNRVLGFKPLVVLGLLSYSIYLWHWPIIAFLHYRGIELAGLVRVVAIVAPIALSALTYVLVERPFRYRLRFGFRVAFPALTVAPALLSFGLHAAVRSTLAPIPIAGAATPAAPEEDDSEVGCKYNRDLSIYKSCVVGANSPHIDGLMIGDSYAGMYAYFMRIIAEDADFSFRQRWFARSPPIPGTCSDGHFQPEQAAYTEKRHEIAAHYDFGILASSWGGYSYGKDSIIRLWNARGEDVSADADKLQLEAIDDLVKHGVKLVLLDRPRAPPGKALMKKIRAAARRHDPLTDVRIPVAKRPDDYILDVIRRKYPSALIIRPDDVYCDEKSCGVALDDTVLYKGDGSHLSREGAEAVARRYLELYPNPLKALRRERGAPGGG